MRKVDAIVEINDLIQQLENREQEIASLEEIIIDMKDEIAQLNRIIDTMF